jgi:formylglycine-generating enzyme required for sulfatase activity
MGVTEVTIRQWNAVMDVGAELVYDDQRPMVGVSWDEARAFCRHLTKLTGRRVRLPTEAEWEYACRAGSTGPYAGDMNEMTWNSRNSGGTAQRVGTKRPNAWGLHDMHGNVWEWCEDRYGEYPVRESIDPRGPASGHTRVNRGGSFDNIPENCRAAVRQWDDPYVRGSIIGFRVVMSHGND